jgi:prolyl oligopeptidase
MNFARPLQICLGICLSSLTAFAQSPPVPKPPDTPRRPVTDVYHGVNITDDYRWLEDWNDPAVKQWSAAENARTRAYLDNLPSRASIKQRFQQLIASRSDRYVYLQSRGGTLFALKYQSSQQQPTLVAMHSANDPASAKIVFDPNVVSAKGSASIEFYTPSLDGKYVAVAVSEGGSEDCSAYVFDVATGKQLPDIVPRVNFATAGGSIDWNANGTGFYYTRYPQASERPEEDLNFYQQVYFHKLGTDFKQDTYSIGKDFPRLAEIQLQTSDDGLWFLATVANGDGGQYEHFVMDSSGHWTQVTRFDDGIVSAKIGPDDSLYLLSRKDAPRGKIMRLPLVHPDLSRATVIVSQSPGTGHDDNAGASIQDYLPTPGHLYVIDIAGGPSRVRVFDDQGRPLTAPPLPPVSAVYQVVYAGQSDALFYIATYLDPPAWYNFDAARGKSVRTAISETSACRFDDAEVVRDFAISKDGTRVPISIIRRKGTKLDGANPVLLHGYGGFGISSQPYFVGSEARVWLDQGGVWAIANIRGGGEYGEEWHKQGMLSHKQNVFDDFIASAQYFVQHNYTSSSRLAIVGGSNGGLLMGAAFTQQPGLFRAVVSYVGIYDMLRHELDPNGSFNTTEYGTVKDPDQFKALYAYSPYHRVQNGTNYPAILFLTGENDHRVNPMQSRKMTARLQAANASIHPIFLRTTSSAGHGIGTALAEQIEESADVASFLFDQLGIVYAPAAE